MKYEDEGLCAGLATHSRVVVSVPGRSHECVERCLCVAALACIVGLLPGCLDVKRGVAVDAGPWFSTEWGARTEGGRAGTIVRVTTLAAGGDGSLRAAVGRAGARIVVFEVGGVIDLDGRNITVREPFLTIAGQTAPSPGITLVRGGLRIQTHDVVVQHLRVRPGEAGHAKKSGWEVDGITTSGGDAHDIVIDHCSISWATDENLTASGPRFAGSTAGEWRQGTSRRITFSNNIVAEGLSRSTHRKGEHSKGTLIHDNVMDITIIANLYAHNVQRNPFFKGGASGVVVNNVIYNPGSKAIHYALRADEWGDRPFQTGKVAVMGNVLKLGPNSVPDLPLMLIEGDGPVELYMEDNVILDRLGRVVQPSELVSDSSGHRKHIIMRFWPNELVTRRATEVFESVLREAGARPWDRDELDRRIVREVRNGGGRIIDTEEQVGGYPRQSSTRRPFRKKEWAFR